MKDDNICGVDALAQLAEVYTSVEDAAALLSVDPVRLQDLVDDPSSPLGMAWRRGRAQARLEILKAQFSMMKTNASLAVHLGRELLGQSGGAPVGPVTYIVDTGISRNGSKMDPDGI